MHENEADPMLIEFDPGTLSVAELQALHQVLQEAVRVAPRLAQWMVDEFLRPELERRQAGAASPAKRYYSFPTNWTDGEIGHSLLLSTGLISGGDFAPAAKPFLHQVAQQVAGLAAARLLRR